MSLNAKHALMVMWEILSHMDYIGLCLKNWVYFK